MSVVVPCGAGRDIGTDMPGWDKPCESEAKVVVLISGVLDRAFPVSLCPEHRELLHALGVIEPPSWTCPDCGMTSHSPQDIRLEYCGNCHTFPETRTP